GVGRRRALRSGLRVDGARPATPLGREGAAREVAAHRSRDGADGGGQRTPDGGRGTHRLGGAHRLARRRLRLRPHGGIPAPGACGPPARWQHGRPALLRRGKDRAPVPTRARGGLMYDLLVTGGTVATATITAPLDVAVQGERIAALGAPGSIGSEAQRIVDANGCIVLPGGVDPHWHYRLEFEGILT